jgi:DNA topoisomerase-1
VALPRSLKSTDVDLDTAVRLLALPRELGRHPESGEAIVAGIGRFGPYLKHGTTFKSLGPDDDVLTIGLNRAVVLLAEPASDRRRGPQLLRELGAHPAGGAIGVYRGRYGPYVSHDGVIASLPRNSDPTTFSLAEALPLLAAQREKGKRPRRKNGKLVAGKTEPRKAAKTGAAPSRKAAGKMKKPRAAKATATTRSTKKPRSRPGVQPS